MMDLASMFLLIGIATLLSRCDFNCEVKDPGANNTWVNFLIFCLGTCVFSTGVKIR